MNYKIKITPAALSDLQLAISYYNKQQIGLGKKFNNAVNTLFSQLSMMPTSGSFMYDAVRFRLVKKFPFIVLYEVGYPNCIVVLGIFNTYQQPFW